MVLLSGPATGDISLGYCVILNFSFSLGSGERGPPVNGVWIERVLLYRVCGDDEPISGLTVRTSHLFIGYMG